MTHTDYLKQMGLRIRAARKAKNMTIHEVCVLAKLDESAVCRIEGGQKNSYVITLKRLAEVLEVDVRDFL